MATMEEIKDYVNGLITNQDLQGFCWVAGSNIKIRIVGQYTDTQLDHLVNQYSEITGYLVQSGMGWVDIFYFYVAV